MNVSLIWFRDDLRVADNPALMASVADGAAVALYVLDEESAGIRALGGAAKWWLHHALLDLRDELERLGIPLILRRGAAAQVLPEVASELGAGTLLWNRRYGGSERAVDTTVKEWASGQGIHAESFQASLLHEPWNVRTGAGNPYQVFTPFWRALSAQDFRAPLGLPDVGCGFDGPLPESDDLEKWELLPTTPDWAHGLRETWRPTAAAGTEALGEFLEGRVQDYSDARDRPDQPGTSRLSPYLRWGQLSPFQVWHALADYRREGTPGPGVFAAELGWREFCWHQLYHNPDLATTNLRRQFDGFPWLRPHASPAQGDGAAVEHLHAWQQGRTGIPLVDAGQRELWHTGFMHNRVRMVAASFLVKNLGIDWRAGEQWFWDTLVDADAASNPANWQWVAGSGADASPFFRIFNPLTQAKKFDPSGKYVSRWVPELLTPEYPEAVVDLAQTRLTALEGYASIK
ncbi:deoxyribodipyrimidine photo-lyase [Arthrobacter sp. GMC3]|uniref:cryptochrome/photolyase family protein n=1 Tax=Arthrobacter sp. GMC3 TaxID=2058894 RepID=UPI000CE3AD2C|nr:deoxyribodipyrimidine photo-lyase [Arthrobacter sp. GMC3]